MIGLTTDDVSEGTFWTCTLSEADLRFTYLRGVAPVIWVSNAAGVREIERIPVTGLIGSVEEFLRIVNAEVYGRGTP